jgi:hypothetical protein
VVRGAVVLLTVALCACSTVTHHGDDKIAFDLSGIGPDGLEGPSDGRRSVDYEYCVPEQAIYVRQVQTIDPTAAYHPDVRGRANCKRGEVLMTGNTHHDRWRETLERLAALRYVKRIIRTFWE